MKIVNYYFGINLIWINFYMDKVLSWKDLGITITKVPGDTDNRCPSYGRVKSVNSSSAINNIIVWPSGRKDTQLILNSYFNPQDYWELKFKNIDESLIYITNINEELSIEIKATHYIGNAGIINRTNLHYKITEGNRILYDDTGKLYNSRFMKCYEVENDGSATSSLYNEFRLTFKSHYKEIIHLEVWVEGHEETKKMIRLSDIFAEDI